MVVGEQPAVKGCGAFSAWGIDRAVGPAVEHRADEALSFAVGLWPIGTRAQVADAENAAGDRVSSGFVRCPVVGEQLLNGDAVALVKRDRAAQERDRGGGLLVGQDLGV